MLYVQCIDTTMVVHVHYVVEARVRARAFSGKDHTAMEDVPRCSICYELIREPVVLPCGHEMCQECFQMSMETANFNCPICRKRCSSWARKRAKNPVDKKRKRELEEYYENFDSLETLELILKMKGKGCQ